MAALALQTLQTAFAAAAWHGILRYAYPETEVRYLGVLACYATGVALNSVTPAHAGTLVTVLMFVAIIPTATVAGVVAAAAVEKLFFAVVGIIVFLYLFLSVGGSFERRFGLLSHHPWATLLAAAAAAIVFGLGGRLAWRRLKGLWEQAKQGGKILSDRRAYVTQVLFPQLLAWFCKVGVVAVLLAAYGIPVGFHTLFSVLGGNTLANVASLTPGGVGVNHAFNVASLHEATTAATASAYSVGHQLPVCRRFDGPGAVTVTGSLLLLVYAISTAPRVGWSTTRTMSLLAASVIALAAFAVIETRVEAPLTPLRIFRLRMVAAANAVGFLLGGSFFAFIFVGMATS